MVSTAARVVDFVDGRQTSRIDSAFASHNRLRPADDRPAPLWGRRSNARCSKQAFNWPAFTDAARYILRLPY